MTTDREIQQEIDHTRIKALFSSGVTGLLGISVAAAIYVSFIWYELDRQLLYAWSGCFAFMVILRIFLTVRFRNQAGENELSSEDVKKWENVFYVTLLLTGLIWVSAIFMPYTDSVLRHVIFVGFMLVSLTGAAISLYSHSFLAMATYLSLSIIPLAIRFFMFGDRSGIILGTASLIYFAIMIRQIRIHNHTLVENIRLSILNRNISLRDPLTGLANRRRLDVFIEKLIPITTRTQISFSIILIDIDNFKIYNDSHGRHGGDVALSAIAQILIEEIHEADLAVRFGGDEFLVVLPDTDTIEAAATAMRIREEINASTYLTISAGVATHHASENFEETLRHADTALYRAKTGGRDQIETYSGIL